MAIGRAEKGELLVRLFEVNAEIHDLEVATLLWGHRAASRPICRAPKATGGYRRAFGGEAEPIDLSVEDV
jgi:hypothetical protein